MAIMYVANYLEYIWWCKTCYSIPLYLSLFIVKQKEKISQVT